MARARRTGQPPRTISHGSNEFFHRQVKNPPRSIGVLLPPQFQITAFCRTESNRFAFDPGAVGFLWRDGARDTILGSVASVAISQLIAALEVPFVINNFGETLFMQRILAAIAVRPKSTARSFGRRVTRMTTDRHARIGR
jgi:hypothetical protein